MIHLFKIHLTLRLGNKINEGSDHLRGARLGTERKICIDEFGETMSFGIQSRLLTSTNTGFS